MIIRTSRQLKDKISNLSGGDSKKAQELIRNYMMERFLARIAESEYRDLFILKGGMLVASLVGMESRTTKDIDVTLKDYPLTQEDAEHLIQEIISTDMDDALQFQFVRCEEIMDQHEYSGVRVHLMVFLDNLRQSINIDISTGDEITPEAVDYTYTMMFDGEKINLQTYNLETLLAEKLETILSGDTLNTRMRDFYDVYLLDSVYGGRIDRKVLRQAILNTAQNRGTEDILEEDEWYSIIDRIRKNPDMKGLWTNYVNRNPYVDDLEWMDVVNCVENILSDTLTEEFGMSGMSML